MFWRKKRPAEIPKQAIVLKTYLATVMPLVAQKLSNPPARGGARVFILGMADMLRQTENLTWDQFVAVYEFNLAEAKLLPSETVGDFVSGVGQTASTSQDVAKLMRHGAQSISMYVGERDANAPTDLISAVMYAEKNASSFAELGA